MYFYFQKNTLLHLKLTGTEMNMNNFSKQCSKVMLQQILVYALSFWDNKLRNKKNEQKKTLQNEYAGEQLFC